MTRFKIMTDVTYVVDLKHYDEWRPIKKALALIVRRFPPVYMKFINWGMQNGPIVYSALSLPGPSKIFLFSNLCILKTSR